MSEFQRILLAGGPFDDARLWMASADEDHVKVADEAGYDHFVLTDEFIEHSGERMSVYRWRYRTFVAE